LISIILRGYAVARAEAPPNPDAAIARGLSFLARQQNNDGSFDGGGPRVATTGLCLLAFLSAGHTPDVGRYGLNVRNAVDFLLNQKLEDGYFGKIDGSRMYGQGIVTLALAEAYGVESEARRKKIQPVLNAAVQLILTAQAVEKPEPFAGGWRYEPQATDSDLSLSGWNALALRAAQNVGMNVPKEPVDRAVAFVGKCFVASAGGFAYQPGGEASAGMTGVGVLNLFLLDAADRPEIQPAAKFLTDHPVTAETKYFYYHLYYTTQAAYQIGGATWPAVWKVSQEHLLAAQEQDGGWPQSRAEEEPGRLYATSMAVLTLTVPYRLLPIYQR
jgi:hypothetical protein